jgi:hypothetical protein
MIATIAANGIGERARPTVKWEKLLALVAITLLSLGASACGGSSSSPKASSPASASDPTSTSESETTAGYTKVDADKDNDGGGPIDEKSNSRDMNFGHAASVSDKRKVTALVKRYYAIALAGDGAKACSMLYSTLAEAVPEDYGEFSGPSYMRGSKTCEEGMTLLFAHFHALLALEVPKLAVTRVRLIEHHGFALLSFGSLPERQIVIDREGHTWKIDGLTDSELV